MVTVITRIISAISIDVIITASSVVITIIISKN